MQRIADLSLLCRVGARICAFPLSSVVETMRPLTIEPVAGAPDCVLGLSIVRASPLPVVDAEQLLGGERSTPDRFVILKVGERCVALAVDAVIGVRSLGGNGLADMPPLVRNADTEAVTAIGALDADLLMILQAARILPDDVLASIQPEALAS